MKQWLKRHFIPYDGNDYKPNILQKGAVAAMLSLVILSFMIANIQSVMWVKVDWMVSAVLPAVLVAETNAERAESNLGTLRRSPVLDAAATAKAQHMAALGYFSHYAPDGTSPWYWFNQAGYSFVHAGENLAVHFDDSEEVVTAWMNSPTHRENIMNGQFTEIGIGVARGEFEGSETIFVVQLFGTPPAAAAAPAPQTTPVTVVTEQTAPAIPAVNNTQIAGAGESVEEMPAAAPVAQPATPKSEPVVTKIEAESKPTPAPTTPALAATEEEEEKPKAAASSTPIMASTDDNAPTSSITRDDDALFSGTLTTSTDEAVAIGSTNNAGSTPTFGGFATSPQLVLQALYVLIGGFVLLALVLSIVIEIRRQHPVQVAYGVGLTAVMFGLFYLHTFITTGVVIA